LIRKSRKTSENLSILKKCQILPPKFVRVAPPPLPMIQINLLLFNYSWEAKTVGLCSLRFISVSSLCRALDSAITHRRIFRECLEMGESFANRVFGIKNQKPHHKSKNTIATPLSRLAALPRVMETTGFWCNVVYYSYILIWILSGYICTSVFLNRLGFSVKSELVKKGTHLFEKCSKRHKICENSSPVNAETQNFYKSNMELPPFLERELFPAAFSSDCMRKMYK
jgi:hypothetical protein